MNTVRGELACVEQLRGRVLMVPARDMFMTKRFSSGVWLWDGVRYHDVQYGFS